MRDNQPWDSGREGVMVIACYKPHLGKEDEMIELIKTHVPNLREWGLAADTPSLGMRSRDGIYIEVFQWKSHQAIEDAHDHPKVLEMWEVYDKVCEYVTLESLSEIGLVFPGFEPIFVT